LYRIKKIPVYTGIICSLIRFYDWLKSNHHRCTMMEIRMPS
jgi:hypothetical protein